MLRILGYLLCLFSLPVLGQVREYYPEDFSVFFYNYNQTNPAYIPEEGSWEINAGYGNRTGPLAKIAHFYASGERIARKKDNSASLYRIIISNEKEGPYIVTPKALFNYAYQLRLKKDSYLAAGISAGAASHRFTAPSPTASGTAFLPDGAAGLTFRSRHVFSGFSIMQMFNADNAPIAGAIRFSRYYNTFLSLDNDLNPFWKIKGSALYKIQPAFRHELDFAIHFSHNETFGFGSMIRVKRGLSFFGAFEVPVGDEKLFLSFTYNSPAFSSIPEFLNSIEIITRLRLY